MSEKKISYLNRTFEEYRDSLLDYVKKYYPQISNTFDDASIGSWLIDIVSAVADNLSYHTDRVYNETNIDSAEEKSSILNLARSNGLKIPGPKASIAEEKFSCYLPVVSEIKNDGSTVGMPNWAYAPVIKKGTKVSSGSQFFEVSEDVDFKEQFDENGNSNRNIYPQKDSNGKIKSYLVEKYTTVVAGETKIFKQVLTNNDIYPFMEIILPHKDIMNIESIIFKDGTDYNSDPTMGEYMNPNEYVPASDSPSNVDTYRFFEVNSLVEQYRWGDDISTTRSSGKQNVGQSTSYVYGYYDQESNSTVPIYSVTKGEWVPITQKFMTEYTDNGYLKIIFGSGEQAGQLVSFNDAGDFSKNQITKMIRNNFLGKLPKSGWTMFVMYRVGGGEASNVALGKINQISYLDAEIGRCIATSKDSQIMGAVRDSIRCENTTPSVSGKDAPSIDEIKNMIKYNNAAQERCVTLKDYINRVMLMPPKYGCPFRVGAIEANNKIMLYLLGIDFNGKLSSVLPSQMIKNIENYLSMYRSINDFVEIKSGRIINISIEADLYLDKNYNSTDVISKIIKTIKEYMDINKHELGEDIYISDLEREVSQVDGVLNLIDLRVYNEYGDAYSKTRCTQSIVESDGDESRDRIDLDESDYILVTDSDEMFEIKYPDENDIRIRAKLR